MKSPRTYVHPDGQTDRRTEIFFGLFCLLRHTNHEHLSKGENFFFFTHATTILSLFTYSVCDEKVKRRDKSGSFEAKFVSSRCGWYDKLLFALSVQRAIKPLESWGAKNLPTSALVLYNDIPGQKSVAVTRRSYALQSALRAPDFMNRKLIPSSWRGRIYTCTISVIRTIPLFILPSFTALILFRYTYETTIWLQPR